MTLGRELRSIAPDEQKWGEVTLLVDASQDDMKRAINDFGDKLDSFDSNGGVALFYYAGHGLQVDGRNYLVPTSARIKGKRDIDVETVDLERVLGKMDESKSRLNVVILDACRNNPFLSDKRAINPGLAQPGSARGTVIAYATGPNSVADDGEGANGNRAPRSVNSSSSQGRSRPERSSVWEPATLRHAWVFPSSSSWVPGLAS